MGALQPILIFDADDTLWENEALYRRCISAVAERTVALGFDYAAAERTIGSVERERVPQVGYAPEEFSRSLVIAYNGFLLNFLGTDDTDFT